MDVTVKFLIVTHFYSLIQILPYAHLIVNVVSWPSLLLFTQSLLTIVYRFLTLLKSITFQKCQMGVQSALLFGSFEASRVA